jgi:thiamine biosynthesis protein ThiS
MSDEKRHGKGMNIIVNGKPTETAADSTLQNLLDQLRLDCRHVVVERNRAIVPRQRFAEEPLTEGDSLEIVHFVGGG